MALSGHDTPIAVISDAGTKSTYTGTLNGVVAGQLVRVGITAMADSGGQTPSAWTVTLGPDTLAYECGDAPSTAFGVAAEFWVIATTSGNLTLTVSTVTNCRALDAHANLITGFDTGTPIAASGTANSHSRNATNLTAPNGMTPAATGNAILGCLGVNGGGATGMAVTGADGSITGQSGANAFNDHSWCYAYAVGAPPATETFAYSWSGASNPRPAAAWIEVKAAAGGGGQTLALGTGSFATTGQPVAMRAARAVPLGAGVYATTGQDIAFSLTKSLPLGVGSFATAGQAVGLMAGRRLALGPGSFATTGQNIAFSTGVTQALAITPMPFDGYVFDAAGGASANVTISGVGTTGDTIQVRGASGAGNTAWHSTTVDVAGNWTVTFAVPEAEWGPWYQPEARIGTDDLTKVSDSATFGCGDVVGLMGQSEIEYLMAVASFWNAQPYPPLDALNLSTIMQTSVGGAIVAGKVTVAAVNSVNLALVALANVFNIVRPGRKLMIVDFAVSGTSRAALMNDANTGRTWTDFADKVALVRSGGSDIGAVVECWYNADAATIDTFGAEWAPLYFGQRWGGGVFTLGTVNPDSTRNPSAPVDHCLWDIEAASSALGRGIFSRDRTKLHIVTPMPFHDTLTTEQRNFTHDASGALISNRIQQLDRPARDTVIAFAGDSRVQTFLGSVGPSAHIVDFDGGTHPLTDSEWGTPQFAMNFVPSILRASGYSVAEPSIIGVEAASDGSYADIIVDLPNGGTLTTLRQFEGLADPGTEPPHYQTVNGIEIRRAADTDALRRPVMKLTETGYPADYRGTVTIVDTGTGTVPSRTGRVRVTPENAFVDGDRLEYLRGEANGHIVEPRDVTAQLFLDQLIEHVPALYDAGALYPMRGVPVQPQPAMLTISLAASLVLGAGSFTTAGQPVAMRAARNLALGAGSFTTTGQDIAIGRGRRLSLGPGSFATTGQDAAMRVSRRLALAAGSFATTGQPIAFLTGTMIALGAGVYATSGQALRMAVHRRLPLGAGAWVTTGQPITISVAANAPRRAAYAADSRVIGTLRSDYS